ncbi:hypothetical protein BGY98DRAFT_940617, partial [Russula aff. rugulosa BPL654]
IIRVPFTGSVKLRSLLLKSGPGEQTPAKFANIDNLDFSDAQDKEPLQQFDITVGREVGEYTLNVARCRDNSDLLYRILGQWSERKQDPVITVYESQANLADHEKIQGTDGNLNMPSH